jgi:hypothetical protein
MPGPREDLIHFQFQQHVDKSGHYRLPSLFYQGVTFGISHQNPHDLYVSFFLSCDVSSLLSVVVIVYGKK